MPLQLLTLWFTGLPASGKTTLSLALASALADLDVPHRVLDGDIVRRAAGNRLGFGREDRRANIARAAELCRQANEESVFAIAAFVSPYREDRAQAKTIVGPAMFREIHVATPLDVCEMRDPKGLYRKARSGEIRQFTGIDDPYEAPESPDLVLDTQALSIAECVARLMKVLETPRT